MRPAEWVPGLVFSAVVCTAAATMVSVAALRGARVQLSALVMIATGVTGIAVSYWLDLMGVSLVLTADLRRGSGWVLWPAMVWSAWIVVRRRRDLTSLEELVGGRR